MPASLVTGANVGPDRQDFGERERSILTLLRPHLVRRYAETRAARRAAAAFAASDQAVVLLDDHGRIDFATPRAQELLSRHGLDALRVRHVHDDVWLLEERRPLGLTPREREILALVAEGHTNAQIAAALWVSPATVGKHLENAYAKLGVTTRTAAVRLVREHGC